MKKISTSFLALAGVTVLGLTQVKAQYQGTFGFGLVLQESGAGAANSGTTLFELHDVDPSGGAGDRLIPTGFSGNLAGFTSDNNANNLTTNLGTFVQGSSSLILKGGSILSYQGGGNVVTGGGLDYVIGTVSGGTPTYPSGFNFVNLPQDAVNLNGTNGDIRWATYSQNIDLLAGLAPGTYALQTFGFISPNTGSNNFENNNGGNYGAQFTVVAASGAVPEPGTWSLMLGGIISLTFLARRRAVKS